VFLFLLFSSGGVGVRGVLHFGTDYLMVLFFGEMSFMRGCGNEGEVNELWMSEVIT
jgi:hypothetical protein